jgi:hypothetical protein
MLLIVSFTAAVEGKREQGLGKEQIGAREEQIEALITSVPWPTAYA